MWRWSAARNRLECPFDQLWEMHGYQQSVARSQHYFPESWDASMKKNQLSKDISSIRGEVLNYIRCRSVIDASCTSPAKSQSTYRHSCRCTMPK